MVRYCLHNQSSDMKIKELKTEHPRIYELAILRQKEAGNKANDEENLSDGYYSFNWADTKEGAFFWDSINDKNYNTFYEKYPDTPIPKEPSVPHYYNNSKGSLYQVAEQRGWGVRLFDLVKRLERNGKKDPLKLEIEKSIVVLQLWLKELEQ